MGTNGFAAKGQDDGRLQAETEMWGLLEIKGPDEGIWDILCIIHSKL